MPSSSSFCGPVLQTAISLLFICRQGTEWEEDFFSGEGATWVALSLSPPFSCLLNQGFLPKREKKKVPFLGTSSARGKEEQTFALVDKEEGGAFLLLAPPFSSPVSNALLLFSPFPPSFLAARGKEERTVSLRAVVVHGNVGGGSNLFSCPLRTRARDRSGSVPAVTSEGRSGSLSLFSSLSFTYLSHFFPFLPRRGGKN